MSNCTGCNVHLPLDQLGCCNEMKECYVCFDCVCPDCGRCKFYHCDCDDTNASDDSY